MGGGRFFGVALAAALAAHGARAQTGSAPGIAAAKPAAPPTSWAYRAEAREDWRLRQASSPASEDQKGHLALELAAREPLDRFSFRGALDAWWDLDGPPRAGPTAGLGTVWDRRNPFVDVLALSAESRPHGSVPLTLVRAGRQDTAHGVPVTFDGAHVLAHPARGLEVFAFGGRGVHFFQVAGGRFDDWLASGGAAWRVSYQLRLEADYRWTRERVELPGGDTTAVDHAYGLTADWLPHHAVRTRTSLRALGGRVSRATAAAVVALPFDVALDVRGFVQPVTLRDVSELDNPYFATLGESRPFARASLELSRTVATRAGELAVQAGWQLRRVLRGPEGPFNRSLGRAWLATSAARLGETGFFASATLERVADDAALRGEGLWAVNGAAGWARGGVRGEVGTLYQRYRYTYYQDVEELADVRSVYGEVRVRLLGRLSLRARYARDASDRVLETFFLGAAQSFE